MEQNPAIPTFTSTCRNCGAELGGTFCSHCGQEHRHERLRVSYWLRDAIDAGTNLDSRIWRTIAELTIRPGRMISEYVGGRRAPFVTPLRYAIATCAVWFFFAIMANDAEAAAVSRFALQLRRDVELHAVHDGTSADLFLGVECSADTRLAPYIGGRP